MQIWIYFRSGAGGDGFANLLERSRDVELFDHHPRNTNGWRLNRFVDNNPMFYAPTVDDFGCFRRFTPFTTSNNRLKQSYIDCVNRNANIVCTSHSLALLEKSECQDIFFKNQIKILLDYENQRQVGKYFTLKNLMAGPVDIEFQNSTKNEIKDLKKFDYVINIERLQVDWEYTKNFCKELKIDLQESEYRDYQDILQGSNKFDQPGTPRYQSSMSNGCYSYQQLN